LSNVSRSLLWAFEILPVGDAPVTDPEAYVNLGLTILPAPFKFKLRPRFLDAPKIIDLEASEADIRLKEWGV
jgi:hypothetical protein